MVTDVHAYEFYYRYFTLPNICIIVQFLLLLTGTSTHDRLSMILLDSKRLADIKKLSGDGQTSCLEGFHSTLNHWHPKMQHFSWLGTYCRYCYSNRIDIYGTTGISSMAFMVN